MPDGFPSSPLLLIVGPDRRSRERYAAFAAAADLRVEHAHNGLQALDKATALRPDIILTDLSVSYGLEPFELCRRLGGDASTKSIPILAVARDSPTEVEEARAAGCISVLVTPCSPERLVVEIMWVLMQTQNDRAIGEPVTLRFLTRGWRAALRQNAQLLEENADLRASALLWADWYGRAVDRLGETRNELARFSRANTTSEFAASIAHEISQPLGAILVDAAACLGWLDSPAPPAEGLRDGLRNIAEAAGRASDVLARGGELLLQRTVKKELLLLNDLVRDVMSLSRAWLQSGPITVQTTLTDGLPTVLGDRVALQQVLVNLLINGVQAMETVEPGARELHVTTRLIDEDSVEIAVRDTGRGLGDVDIDRMFTSFYTTKPAGTGLGLSISRSIVEAHGGRLWAEPNAGPGATFRLTIPAAAARGIDPVFADKTVDAGQSRRSALLGARQKSCVLTPTARVARRRPVRYP
jgi:signal transduction histidine kinase